MAITSFIDPFGSMVRGYQEGQQTEIQRQAAKRDMRDSDYEYRNRLQMDPLRRQYLEANVNKALFENLMDKDRVPLEIELLREDAAAREMTNFETAATRNSRINAANLDPLRVQAMIDATRAGISSTQVNTDATRARTAQDKYIADFQRSILDLARTNPELGIPMIKSFFSGYGVAPEAVANAAKSQFPQLAYEQQIGQVIDPMYAQAYQSISDNLAASMPLNKWESMPAQEKEALIFAEMEKRFGKGNYGVQLDARGNPIMNNQPAAPVPAAAPPAETSTPPPTAPPRSLKDGGLGLS